MFDELCAVIRTEFPDFQIVPKASSWLMKAIGKFLWLVTFGKAKTFMNDFTTTIGHTVYVATDWAGMDDASKCILLRHERVHMRQARQLGRFLFSFLYLVPFCPIGLAYWRAKFEQEAYEESMRATVEYRGTNIVFSPDYKTRMIRHFTGPDYGWMWPFPKSIEKWFSTTLDRVIFGYLNKTPKSARVMRKL